MKSFSRVWLLATPWTVAHQAPPSRGFSRQEYWSRVPLPSPWVKGLKYIILTKLSLLLFFTDFFFFLVIKRNKVLCIPSAKLYTLESYWVLLIAFVVHKRISCLLDCLRAVSDYILFVSIAPDLTALTWRKNLCKCCWIGFLIDRSTVKGNMLALPRKQGKKCALKFFSFLQC